MVDETSKSKILLAARSVFLRKGLAGARMQEIADTAGINKALLHYYFGNKESLFTSSFQSLLKEILPRFFGVFTTNLSFEEKVHTLGRNYVEFLSDHPQLPVMILSEIQREPKRLLDQIQIGELIDLSTLQHQLDEEAAQGNIRKISVAEFLINTISLLVFPFAAKPIFQNVMSFSDSQFQKFIDQRKSSVSDFILNALKPH
ncbi:TetR/AcrR family transcriptional regulator [Ekhidna sp. MALMAid0563]|uniref:TetR/AcrR family transcriptional regulator n=1 Tax=Ekhidna sp. MALMAid0563 TaxID=3143937 RepID=UPI0032E05210